MRYFATPFLDADGGVMITASHNPPEYNGLKFVKRGSHPMGYSSGLDKIEKMILADDLETETSEKGTVQSMDVMNDFVCVRVFMYLKIMR